MRERFLALSPTLSAIRSNLGARSFWIRKLTPWVDEAFPLCLQSASCILLHCFLVKKLISSYSSLPGMKFSVMRNFLLPYLTASSMRVSLWSSCRIPLTFSTATSFFTLSTQLVRRKTDQSQKRFGSAGKSWETCWGHHPPDLEIYILEGVIRFWHHFLKSYMRILFLTFLALNWIEKI